MAKIVLSALIDQISGRWNGDVFQTWKGIVYARRGTFPRQPRTIYQANIRKILSDLAKEYDTLSAARHDAWDYYASQLPDPMSGFNAWCKNNTILIHANHPSLSKIYDPPSVPSPPIAPGGFTLTYSPATDSWNASWTSPNNPDIYVQAFYSIQTGYNDSLFPMWRFAETRPSTDPPISISASQYQPGTRIRVRLRSLDTEGEVSAWTTTLIATKS